MRAKKAQEGMLSNNHGKTPNGSCDVDRKLAFDVLTKWVLHQDNLIQKWISRMFQTQGACVFAVGGIISWQGLYGNSPIYVFMVLDIFGIIGALSAWLITSIIGDEYFALIEFSTSASHVEKGHSLLNPFLYHPDYSPMNTLKIARKVKYIGIALTILWIAFAIGLWALKPYLPET